MPSLASPEPLTHSSIPWTCIGRDYGTMWHQTMTEKEGVLRITREWKSACGMTFAIVILIAFFCFVIYTVYAGTSKDGISMVGSTLVFSSLFVSCLFGDLFLLYYAAKLFSSTSKRVFDTHKQVYYRSATTWFHQADAPIPWHDIRGLQIVRACTTRRRSRNYLDYYDVAELNMIDVNHRRINIMVQYNIFAIRTAAKCLASHLQVPIFERNRSR